MFCEESYNAFFTLLNFITKLNYNQFNIKKNKIDEDNFRKKYYKKKTQKKLKKKPCDEKLYQSIVFCKEKLVFTCNCNS
jgi:peptide methionine sulfoxide reductase MsrB